MDFILKKFFNSTGKLWYRNTRGSNPVRVTKAEGSNPLKSRKKMDSKG